MIDKHPFIKRIREVAFRPLVGQLAGAPRITIWRQDGQNIVKHVESLETQIKDLKSDAAIVRAFVDEQAEDETLWFNAQTGPEDYLMRALRQLHSVVENNIGEE